MAPLLPGLQDEADAMLPNISRHASTDDRIEGVLSGLQSSSIAEVRVHSAAWPSGSRCLAAWLPGYLSAIKILHATARSLFYRAVYLRWPARLRKRATWRAKVETAPS